jgi:hypothetical protein
MVPAGRGKMARFELKAYLGSLIATLNDVYKTI